MFLVAIKKKPVVAPDHIYVPKHEIVEIAEAKNVLEKALKVASAADVKELVRQSLADAGVGRMLQPMMGEKPGAE